MASPVQYNIDLANRQIQVNEWAYNNKTDTLFFFQLLFISLMFVTVLMCVRSFGQLSGEFVWYSIGVLTLINVVIIINRSVYTNTKRDTRNWNKKKFGGDNTTDSPITRGDKNYQAYIDNVRSKYGPPPAAGGTSGAKGSGATQCVCPTTGVKCC
jgi:amino acid permease